MAIIYRQILLSTLLIFVKHLDAHDQLSVFGEGFVFKKKYNYFVIWIKEPTFG